METIPPPVMTYIPTATSDERIAWFKKYKKPHLDKLVGLINPGQEETTHIHYPDANVIRDFFAKAISDQYSGIRIYFGSNHDASSGRDEKGKLAFIYVPTIMKGDASHRSSDKYYLSSSRRPLSSIAREEAQQLITNYQSLKLTLLHSTLCDHDLSNKHGETKYLFINKEEIVEIRDEITYQLSKPEHGVVGINLYVGAYTDKEIIHEGKYLSQRLTVHYIFVDKDGKDIDLTKIDRRYDIFKEVPIVGGYNTFDPIPPFPDEDGPSEPGEPI